MWHGGSLRPELKPTASIDYQHGRKEDKSDHMKGIGSSYGRQTPLQRPSGPCAGDLREAITGLFTKDSHENDLRESIEVRRHEVREPSIRDLHDLRTAISKPPRVMVDVNSYQEPHSSSYARDLRNVISGPSVRDSVSSREQLLSAYPRDLRVTISGSDVYEGSSNVGYLEKPSDLEQYARNAQRNLVANDYAFIAKTLKDCIDPKLTWDSGSSALTVSLGEHKNQLSNSKVAYQQAGSSMSHAASSIFENRLMMNINPSTSHVNINAVRAQDVTSLSHSQLLSQTGLGVNLQANLYPGKELMMINSLQTPIVVSTPLQIMEAAAVPKNSGSALGGSFWDSIKQEGLLSHEKSLTKVFQISDSDELDPVGEDFQLPDLSRNRPPDVRRGRSRSPGRHQQIPVRRNSLLRKSPLSDRNHRSFSPRLAERPGREARRLPRDLSPRSERMRSPIDRTVRRPRELSPRDTRGRSPRPRHARDVSPKRSRRISPRPRQTRDISPQRLRRLSPRRVREISPRPRDMPPGHSREMSPRQLRELERSPGRYREMSPRLYRAMSPRRSREFSPHQLREVSTHNLRTKSDYRREPLVRNPSPHLIKRSHTSRERLPVRREGERPRYSPEAVKYGRDRSRSPRGARNGSPEPYRGCYEPVKKYSEKIKGYSPPPVRILSPERHPLNRRSYSPVPETVRRYPLENHRSSSPRSRTPETVARYPKPPTRKSENSARVRVKSPSLRNLDSSAGVGSHSPKVAMESSRSVRGLNEEDRDSPSRSWDARLQSKRKHKGGRNRVEHQDESAIDLAREASPISVTSNDDKEFGKRSNSPFFDEVSLSPKSERVASPGTPTSDEKPKVLLNCDDLLQGSPVSVADFPVDEYEEPGASIDCQRNLSPVSLEEHNLDDITDVDKDRPKSALSDINQDELIVTGSIVDPDSPSMEDANEDLRIEILRLREEKVEQKLKKLDEESRETELRLQNLSPELLDYSPMRDTPSPLLDECEDETRPERHNRDKSDF